MKTKIAVEHGSHVRGAELALNDLGGLLALLVKKGVIHRAELGEALAVGPDADYAERVAGMVGAGRPGRRRG